MNDLVDTTEMYLRTIYDLEEEGVVPLRARIAERLDQSGPTVSQTVSRMERDGLLHVAGDRHLELTEKGRQLAGFVGERMRGGATGGVDPADLSSTAGCCQVMQHGQEGRDADTGR
ncbi:metal-dependent transcriptional regulator, partial [Mycolicibacterium holsaticum]|uniref:metal-dependent transcriptional regulator n=1 Tax=Mycolicibacterium holsaticum TaxID=152142 RepID=UPI000B1DC49B